MRQHLQIFHKLTKIHLPTFTKNQQNVKFRLALENKTSASLFYKFFIGKKTVDRVTEELLVLYELNEDTGGKIIDDIKEFYERFQEAEYFPLTLEPFC